MNLKKIILGCSFSSAVIMSSCGKDDDQAMLSTADRNFMTQAAYGNLAEVDAGTLASTKGTNDSVKIFGMMMVMDHQKAFNTLDSLAKTKGVTVPSTIDSEHVALRQRLTSLSGRSFDTAYMNSQVKDHLKTITLFQAQSSGGTDQSTRDYANKFLPAIQMHYTMADRLSKKL